MKAQMVRVILMIAGKAPLNGSLDREIARAVSRGDARRGASCAANAGRTVRT